MTQKAIREALNSIQGDGEYEITFSEKGDYASLILHYSCFTIKNEFNEQHLIRDLYVKIDGYKDKRKSIYGLRGYQSYGEFCSGYQHSHLNPGTPNNFNNFCLGTSELTMLLHEDIFQSEEYLRYFCIVLGNYLCWESIEGTPYIKMSTVSPFGKLTQNPYYRENWLRNLKLDIKLDVNINFTIKNTIEVENELYKELLKIRDEYYISCGTVNKLGNIYYSLGQGANRDNHHNKRLFDFNKKEVRLQIEEFKQEENEKITKTIHPEITQIWCRRASRAIKNRYLTSNKVNSKVA